MSEPAFVRNGETARASGEAAQFERHVAGWAALAAVLCFAVLCGPFFARRVYVADDLGEFHLPVRNFYAQQLARGDAFDWMPSLYGGFYIAGEGQLGAYHPWHLFLYRFLPLGAAFDIELLASYPLLFLGTYLLLQRLVARRDAALLGALVFTFGGFNLLHFVHPNAIAIVAHLPWMLLAADVALATPSRRRRAWAESALALLVASQLLLGYPQYVWFSLLAGVALIAWRMVLGQARRARLVSIGVAVTLGAMIGAVQWLPTWHVLGESVRQTADPGFANTGSLHPLNLVQLFAPYLFQTRVVGQNTHELGLYAGAVSTVLCLWLLSRRREWGRYRPLVRGLLVFCALALLLAAGEYGGLYRLQSLVPLANRFRFPCRAIVLVQLGMAGLTAVAAVLLFETAIQARRGAHTTDRDDRVLWLAVLASVALALSGPLVWPQYVASPLLVWSGPLLVGLAALLVALVERGVRGAAVALVLFAATDLSAYGMSYAVYGRTAGLHEYVADVALPPDTVRPRAAAPAPAKGPRVGDRMLLAGVTRVDGYAGLEPAKQLDYRDPRSWQLAGAHWAWQQDDDRAGHKRRWVSLSPTAPRVRLVAQTRAAPGAADAESWSLEFVAVEPPLSLPPSEPGTARVVRDAPGNIVVETVCPARQLLVTTESFDSGWQVTVDGKPGTVVRVDGDFLGCVVDSGDHRVAFTFQPRARWLGMLVGACGLGLLMAVACVRWTRCPQACTTGDSP